MQISGINLKKYVPVVLENLHRYAVFLFIVTFLGIYVYQVNRTGQLIQDEPSASAVSDKLKPVTQLKIDLNSINQVTELEAQNIEVKTLFNNARQNPFVE